MLCLIAKLDPASTARLSALRHAVLPIGASVPALYGHITIAVWLPRDEQPFISDCRALAAGLPPFRVAYKRLDVLPATSIVVASPERSGPLLALHDNLAARWAPSLDRWTCDDAWCPHTTLLYDPEADLERCCHAMEALFVPFSADVPALELSRVTDSGYEIIERFPLSN